MTCPVCKDKGLKSRVFDRGSSTTLMGYYPYYDEDGKYHNHDGNRISTLFKCSNEHVWEVISYHKCECGWTRKESSQRIIDNGTNKEK